MKVSIILNVYNAEKTLAETLDSILKQTVSDYELIVINDGSDDNTANILNAYRDKFPEINMVYQENKGLGHSRNKALQISKYAWVAFIDADDIWHPKKLEYQLNALHENVDADFIICGNQEFNYDASPLVFVDDEYGSIPDAKKESDMFRQLAEINFTFNPPAILCKKSRLMDYGGFTDDISGQDYYPFLCAALHDHVFYRLDPKLYFVRITPNSLSRFKKSAYFGALARVRAIERIVRDENHLHAAFLTKEKCASLEMGYQKFLGWTLYGLRCGFTKKEMLALYMPILLKISDKKIVVVEFLKLLLTLLLPVQIKQYLSGK